MNKSELLGFIKNLKHNSLIEEGIYKDKRVQLNKPIKGDITEYKIYIKNPKTDNIRKVNFGKRKNVLFIENLINEELNKINNNKIIK